MKNTNDTEKQSSKNFTTFKKPTSDTTNTNTNTTNTTTTTTPPTTTIFTNKHIIEINKNNKLLKFEKDYNDIYSPIFLLEAFETSKYHDNPATYPLGANKHIFKNNGSATVTWYDAHKESIFVKHNLFNNTTQQNVQKMKELKIDIDILCNENGMKNEDVEFFKKTILTYTENKKDKNKSNSRMKFKGDILKNAGYCIHTALNQEAIHEMILIKKICEQKATLHGKNINLLTEAILPKWATLRCDKDKSDEFLDLLNTNINKYNSQHYAIWYCIMKTFKTHLMNRNTKDLLTERWSGIGHKLIGTNKDNENDKTNNTINTNSSSVSYNNNSNNNKNKHIYNTNNLPDNFNIISINNNNINNEDTIENINQITNTINTKKGLYDRNKKTTPITTTTTTTNHLPITRTTPLQEMYKRLGNEYKERRKEIEESNLLEEDKKSLQNDINREIAFSKPTEEDIKAAEEINKRNGITEESPTTEPIPSVISTTTTTTPGRKYTFTKNNNSLVTPMKLPPPMTTTTLPSLQTISTNTVIDNNTTTTTNNNTSLITITTTTTNTNNTHTTEKTPNTITTTNTNIITTTTLPLLEEIIPPLSSSQTSSSSKKSPQQSQTSINNIIPIEINNFFQSPSLEQEKIVTTTTDHAYNNYTTSPWSVNISDISASSEEFSMIVNKVNAAPFPEPLSPKLTNTPQILYQPSPLVSPQTSLQTQSQNELILDTPTLSNNNLFDENMIINSNNINTSPSLTTTINTSIIDNNNVNDNSPELSFNLSDIFNNNDNTTKDTNSINNTTTTNNNNIEKQIENNDNKYNNNIITTTTPTPTLTDLEAEYNNTINSITSSPKSTKSNNSNNSNMDDTEKSEIYFIGKTCNIKLTKFYELCNIDDNNVDKLYTHVKNLIDQNNNKKYYELNIITSKLENNKTNIYTASNHTILDYKKLLKEELINGTTVLLETIKNIDNDNKTNFNKALSNILNNIPTEDDYNLIKTHLSTHTINKMIELRNLLSKNNLIIFNIEKTDDEKDFTVKPSSKKTEEINVILKNVLSQAIRNRDNVQKRGLNKYIKFNLNFNTCTHNIIETECTNIAKAKITLKKLAYNHKKNLNNIENGKHKLFKRLTEGTNDENIKLAKQVLTNKENADNKKCIKKSEGFINTSYKNIKNITEIKFLQEAIMEYSIIDSNNKFITGFSNWEEKYQEEKNIKKDKLEKFILTNNINNDAMLHNIYLNSLTTSTTTTTKANDNNNNNNTTEIKDKNYITKNTPPLNNYINNNSNNSPTTINICRPTKTYLSITDNNKDVQPVRIKNRSPPNKRKRELNAKINNTIDMTTTTPSPPPPTKEQIRSANEAKNNNNNDTIPIIEANYISVDKLKNIQYNNNKDWVILDSPIIIQKTTPTIKNNNIIYKKDYNTSPNSKQYKIYNNSQYSPTRSYTSPTNTTTPKITKKRYIQAESITTSYNNTSKNIIHSKNPYTPKKDIYQNSNKYHITKNNLQPLPPCTPFQVHPGRTFNTVNYKQEERSQHIQPITPTINKSEFIHPKRLLNNTNSTTSSVQQHQQQQNSSNNKKYIYNKENDNNNNYNYNNNNTTQHNNNKYLTPQIIPMYQSTTIQHIHNTPQISQNHHTQEHNYTQKNTSKYNNKYL